jgi:hypothetical protein
MKYVTKFHFCPSRVHRFYKCLRTHSFAYRCQVCLLHESPPQNLELTLLSKLLVSSTCNWITLDLSKFLCWVNEKKFDVHLQALLDKWKLTKQFYVSQKETCQLKYGFSVSYDYTKQTIRKNSAEISGYTKRNRLTLRRYFLGNID